MIIKLIMKKKKYLINLNGNQNIKVIGNLNQMIFQIYHNY